MKRINKSKTKSRPYLLKYFETEVANILEIILFLFTSGRNYAID